MTVLFKSNLDWFKKNQPSFHEILVEQSPVIEFSADDEGELWINDELLFEDYNTELSTSFLQQLTVKQRRIRTPRIESSKGAPSLAVLAEDFVDQHNGPFLNHLPIFSDYKTNHNLAVSRDLAVLGSLFLLPLATIVESQDDSHNRIESVTLIESDLDNFVAALYCVDFQKLVDLFRSKNILFHFIFQDSKGTLVDYTYAYFSQKIPTALHSLTVLLQPKCHPLLSSLYSWFFSQSGIGYRFLGTIGTSSDELNQVYQGLWASASLDNNSKLIGESVSLKEKSVPALIVAGGPSLDDFIPQLKECQDKYYIVAAGSSIGSLLRASIRPNACVFLERGSTVFHSVKSLLDDGFNFDNIVLITSETTDPRLRSLFASTITYHRPTSSLAALFQEEVEHALIHAGPEAANAALDSVIALGFSEIHIVGCDFSARDRSIPRASNAIGISPRLLDEPVLSNKGRTVYTQPNLSMTRDLFEASISFAAAYLTKSLKVYRYGEGLPIDFAESCESIPSDISSCDLSNELLLGSLSSKNLLSSTDIEAINLNFQKSLSSYFDSLLTVLTEISTSGSYNHSKLTPFLNLYESPMDASKYDLLVRRILRQIVFYMIAPLFDSISTRESHSVDTCVLKLLSSCQLLKDFVSHSFFLLTQQLSEGRHSSEWSPEQFRDSLIASFNNSDQV